MAIKIATAIQKGGVSKTTTTAILAELLSASGYKIAVLDLDSQGNATKMLTQRNIYEFSEHSAMEAIKERSPGKYMVEVKENLYLLPGEDMLATFSRYIYTEGFSEPMNVLAASMEELESEYDFILIDLPPNLGDIVLNALAYADYVLIPTQCEAFGMDALDRFVRFINEVKAEGHTSAEIIGILLTMRDSRALSEKLIADSIRRSYGELVFKAEIKRRARLKDFALVGTTMDRKSDVKALEDYLEFTEELIERVKQKGNSRAAEKH